MDFNQYLNAVIVVVCLGVGYILKHLVPGKTINKFIPLINGVLGVGLNIWINLSFDPTILVVGLISGLASTGFYEMFKQFVEMRKSNAPEDGSDE